MQQEQQLELLTYRLRKVSERWIVNFTGDWQGFPSYHDAQEFIGELETLGYHDLDRLG